jgi:hypothetical protein
MIGVFAAVLLAQPFPTALIDRPLTLPRGAVEVNALVNYSDWNEDGGSATGESGVLGIEIGATRDVQIGFAAALPLNPGFGFGSLVGSVLVNLGPAAAHFAAGYERLGVVGVSSGGGAPTSDSFGLLFGSVGVPVKLRLAPGIAFVSGTTSAFKYAFPVNLGAVGVGVYEGGAINCFSCGDLVTVAHATSGGNGALVNVNVPIGLLFQVAEPLSVTLFTGYHAVFEVGGNSSESIHFIPIGVEAVLSPSAGGEFGVSFMLPGEVAQSSGTALGYADVRNVAAFLRLRFL